MHFIHVSYNRNVLIFDSLSKSFDIEANNCAILQRDNKLELWKEGQYPIIDLKVTFRGLFPLGENWLRGHQGHMNILFDRIKANLSICSPKLV